MELELPDMGRAPLTPENIATCAENRIAYCLALVNAPRGVDAVTHAQQVRDIEQYVEDFRENQLPGMIALFVDAPPPVTVPPSEPTEEEAKTAEPAPKRVRTQA